MATCACKQGDPCCKMSTTPCCVVCWDMCSQHSVQSGSFNQGQNRSSSPTSISQQLSGVRERGMKGRERCQDKMGPAAWPGHGGSGAALACTGWQLVEDGSWVGCPQQWPAAAALLSTNNRRVRTICGMDCERLPLLLTTEEGQMRGYPVLASCSCISIPLTSSLGTLQQ